MLHCVRFVFPIRCVLIQQDFLLVRKLIAPGSHHFRFKNYTIYNKLEGLERFHLHVNAPISRACIYILKSSELEVN